MGVTMKPSEAIQLLVEIVEKEGDDHDVGIVLKANDLVHYPTPKQDPNNVTIM